MALEMGNLGYFHPEISGVYGPQQKITGYKGPPCRSLLLPEKHRRWDSWMYSNPTFWSNLSFAYIVNN